MKKKLLSNVLVSAMYNRAETIDDKDDVFLYRTIKGIIPETNPMKGLHMDNPYMASYKTLVSKKNKEYLTRVFSKVFKDKVVVFSEPFNSVEDLLKEIKGLMVISKEDATVFNRENTDIIGIKALRGAINNVLDEITNEILLETENAYKAIFFRNSKIEIAGINSTALTAVQGSLYKMLTDIMLIVTDKSNTPRTIAEKVRSTGATKKKKVK